jgi:exosortase
MSQTISPPVDSFSDTREPTRPPAVLVVAVLALALAHLPLLVAHGFALWGRPHYQFFPIVLVGAGLLAWPAVKAAWPGTGNPTERTTWLLLGLNWLVLAAALVLDSPWLGAVAFMVLLVALAHGLGGWPLLRATLPALVFLLLIIPPPFGLDTRLVNGLQTLTSKCGAYVLDYFGILHLQQGNLIEVAGKKYFVEEACSGINSLLSVLACTVFYVFWAGAHWLRGILLIAAAVFWVLIANIVRVVTIVYLDSRFQLEAKYNVDLLHGWAHATLGLILFGLVLLLLASTDRLLLFLGTSVSWGKKAVPLVPAAPPAPADTSRTRPRRAWAFALPVAVAYAALVLLQAVGYAAGIGEYARPIFDARVVEVCNAFDADALPAAIGNWQRDPKNGFAKRDAAEMYYADHSRTWIYSRGGTRMTVSLDYPYPEWHGLKICYEGTGWTVTDENDFRHPLPEQSSELACEKFSIQKPPTRNGKVWFCSFDERGDPVKRLSQTDFRWSDRFQSLAAGLGKLGGAAPTIRRQVIQVQALTESYLQLGETEAKDAEQLFLTAAAKIRQKYVASIPAAR